MDNATFTESQIALYTAQKWEQNISVCKHITRINNKQTYKFFSHMDKKKTKIHNHIDISNSLMQSKISKLNACE